MWTSSRWRDWRRRWPAASPTASISRPRSSAISSPTCSRRRRVAEGVSSRASRRRPATSSVWTMTNIAAHLRERRQSMIPVLKDAVNAVGRQKGLDNLAESLQKAIARTYAAGGKFGRHAQNALNGVWLGHPLHPALTDLPIGFWTAALA